MKSWWWLFLNVIISAVTAVSIIQYRGQIFNKSEEELIRDYYATENAVLVSPHSVRKQIMYGESDFVLVDLRSKEEYEKAHVVGAVNIPAYIDPNKSIDLTKAAGERERIVEEFEKLPKDKKVIVYCYSTPCMTGRKVGKMLTEEGIFVKHLGIGWSEWRYYWDLWNHDGETPSKMEDYIAVGSEPGVFIADPLKVPCGESEFGC